MTKTRAHWRQPPAAANPSERKARQLESRCADSLACALPEVEVAADWELPLRLLLCAGSWDTACESGAGARQGSRA